MPREGIAAMFEQLFNKEADDVEGEVEVEVEEEDLKTYQEKKKENEWQQKPKRQREAIRIKRGRRQAITEVKEEE